MSKVTTPGTAGKASIRVAQNVADPEEQARAVARRMRHRPNPRSQFRDDGREPQKHPGLGSQPDVALATLPPELLLPAGLIAPSPWKLWSSEIQFVRWEWTVCA